MRASFRTVAVRAIVASMLATAFVYSPACSSSDSHDQRGPADVIYDTGTTDEALSKLLDAQPKNDPARAPTFTSPTPNQKLSAATPATFSWKATPTGMRRAAPPKERFALGPSIESTAAGPIGGERSAHAHGDPLNGRAYFVVFSASGNVVVRVFTTKTSYTPDDAAWTKLKGVKAPITATITSASFDNNNLTPDGGPFAGTPVTFTIE
jgi:hypothetical protein